MNLKSRMTLCVAAGVLLGAAAIQALHAQAKPPIYAVVEINEITDAAGYSKVSQRPNTGTVSVQMGGRYLARGGKITALDGTAPQRYVILSFDSIEKAQAWYNSPGQKEVVAIRTKTTKSRSFLVEGM